MFALCLPESAEKEKQNCDTAAITQSNLSSDRPECTRKHKSNLPQEKSQRAAFLFHDFSSMITNLLRHSNFSVWMNRFTCARRFGDLGTISLISQPAPVTSTQAANRFTSFGLIRQFRVLQTYRKTLGDLTHGGSIISTRHGTPVACTPPRVSR